MTTFRTLSWPITCCGTYPPRTFVAKKQCLESVAWLKIYPSYRISHGMGAASENLYARCPPRQHWIIFNLFLGPLILEWIDHRKELRVLVRTCQTSIFEINRIFSSWTVRNQCPTIIVTGSYGVIDSTSGSLGTMSNQPPSKSWCTLQSANI